ncbi:MAG TPA: hypothetical protein VMY37_04520 [Thermoguttaceae bacterium]|nr:hypothetical protein [Thermoguttaceae bacterium]
MPQASEFLGAPRTAEYVPTLYHSGWSGLRRRMPPFNLHQVDEMLTDARVEFGLRLIKGPVLSKSRFFIDCNNPEVKEFLKNTVVRFWRTSAARALKALEWGFSCSEVMYRPQKGRLEYETLKDLHSLDCRAITQQGKFLGATVQHVPGRGRQKVGLVVPKVLWHIHAREKHPWYGRSRLQAAYLPWVEMWSDGGYRDARTLWYHRNAFDSGTMRHPQGMIKIDENRQVPAKDLAREIMEKKKTGGVLTLPNTQSQGPGIYDWTYEPPNAPAPPAELLEYGENLRDEIAEGMGVPPEIIRAEGTGAYAGRQIPMDAFYAMLQEIVYWLMFDVDQQVLRPLVEVNFGPEIEYEVIPFGILRPSAEEHAVEREAQSPRAIPPMSMTDWLTEPRYGIEIISDEPPVGYTPKWSNAA